MRGRCFVMGLLLAGCGGGVTLETSDEEGGAGSGGASTSGEASGGEAMGGGSTGGDGGDLGDGGSGGAPVGEPPQWRPASRDVFGCGVHTATVLDDDRALVVGECGDARGPLDALVYDASTESFREIVMPEPRLEHAAIRMTDGRVALVGGGSYVLVVSPDSGAVEWGGHLLEERTFPALALLPDGRIWVIGGYGTDFDPLVSTELVDLAAGSTVSGPSLREPRMGASALALGDGRVWIVGDASGNASGTEMAACPGCPFEQGPALATPEGEFAVAGAVLGGAAVVFGVDSSAWLDGDALSAPIPHEQSFFFPTTATQGDVRVWAAGISLWSGELHVFSAAPGGRFELYATRFGSGGGDSITVLRNRALLLSGDATLLDLPD